jgi:hypothetical protein
MTAQSREEAWDKVLGVKDEHPAYGMIRFVRRCGGAGVLVGSSIRHSQTVAVEIVRARRRRKHNEYAFYEDAHSSRSSSAQFSSPRPSPS